MYTLRIYTSTSNVKLADLALGLDRLGQQVVLLPLSELPPRPAAGRPASLRLELQQLQEELTPIGELLDLHTLGARRLDAGTHQGLLARHDDLLSRKRGIERALAQLEKGGQHNG